jgi:hypothetical protein
MVITPSSGSWLPSSHYFASLTWSGEAKLPTPPSSLPSPTLDKTKQWNTITSQAVQSSQLPENARHPIYRSVIGNTWWHFYTAAGAPSSSSSSSRRYGRYDD